MSPPGSDPYGSAPVTGQQVGPYLLHEVLGSGGVATVYRATDAAGRPVAFKVLHPSRIVDEDVKRFAREYRALARLDHPNVVHVFEAGVHDSFPWLALEYVAGSDLAAVVERWDREQPPDRHAQVERIFRGLCAGLQYVHERGLVHRDLKPSNVLVDASGVAKVTDFGVVKDESGNQTQLTLAGRLVGTVAFMAPEQITSDKVDARADLYALGAVLYVMLTSKRPIEATSVAGYLARHLTEVPRPPIEIDATVPRRLDGICQRLLMKERGQRFASARAVLEALDRSEGPDAWPLRGREAETDAWKARVLAVANGGGGVSLWTGPEGSGRTALLAWLAEIARGMAVGVAQVDGPGGGLLGRLADAAGAAPARDPAGRLATATADRPWVLVIDDLDDADPSDVDALGRWIRAEVAIDARPVLVVGTARAVDAPPAVAAFAAGSTTGIPSEVRQILPLERRSFAAIVRDRGLAGPVSTVLARRLHEDFDGQPGPALEQLDALVDAGWLERGVDVLRPTRPVEAFRRDPLPVPAAVSARLERQIAPLDDGSRDVVSVLAVLDRPASPTFLAACAETTESVVERLVILGLLRALDGEEETVGFTHPAAALALRSRLHPEARRRWHAEIARQLGRRRRREGTVEIAHHLLESGDVVTAYPAFVQAVRMIARTGRHAEVLDLVRRAVALEPLVESSLGPAEMTRLRRWTSLLEGEARLGRAEGKAAIPPLEQAVALGRIEGDVAATARANAALGRARHRVGDLAGARGPLEEAVATLAPDAPERPGAVRTLADARLHTGDVAGADALATGALAAAREAGAREAEARARRSLAHVRVFQGRLLEAARLLTDAEDLLASVGDDHVRAGVLARATELDLVAGRIGAALGRAERLDRWVTEHELGDRRAEARALLAEARLCALDTEGATEVLKDVLATPTTVDVRLRVARMWCLLGRPGDAAAALPRPEEVVHTVLDDVAGWTAALRAWSLGREAPDTARDLAAWAASRLPGPIGIRNARIAIDLARAFAAAGATDPARAAAKRALKILQSLPGPEATDGLLLDALIALDSAAPDARVQQAAAQVVSRLTVEVPASLEPAWTAWWAKKFFFIPSRPG